jgi:hypothetical protein
MAGFGLRLAKSQGMEGYTGNLIEFDVDPANTDPIFTGDVVTFAGGFVQEATEGGTIASQNDFSILGVFMGCRFVDADGGFEFKNQWNGGAGRSDIKATVAVPAHGMFWIKGQAGATYTQADIGTRKGVLYNVGSTQYGDSRMTLGAPGASVATGPLIVHRLAPLPGNTFASDEPIFEVSVARSAGYGTTL